MKSNQVERPESREPRRWVRILTPVLFVAACALFLWVLDKRRNETRERQTSAVPVTEETVETSQPNQSLNRPRLPRVSVPNNRSPATISKPENEIGRASCRERVEI